jgi:membrane carboxypeptidase/penicillin-binding protein PbpC
LIRVNSDQILQVSINGNARISVFYIDGRPIEDANGLQSVSLQMPTSGDYTIEITSTNTTDFQLNVDVL